MSKDINEIRYFNFPICLIKDIFNNKIEVFNNIWDYSIYKHALNLKFGTIKEKIKASFEYFKVKGSEQGVLENGKHLFDKIPNNSPITNISINVFFDFYENNKNEFEITVFCGYCAIRSILLLKPYCKTTNDYMLVRMAGLSNVKEINNLPEPFKKHTRTHEAKRYYLNKIKIELRVIWNLNIYAKYTRGFYVSFNQDINYLAMEAAQKTQKYKSKKYLQEQTKAHKFVCEYLAKFHNNTITTP